MSTKLDARQSISRDLLDQIALVTNKELDDLLRSINKELTPPFQMHQDTGSNRVLKIEDYTVTNPETLRKKSIPPISNTLPTGVTFPISLTFPASSGGSVSISGTAFSGSTPTVTVSSGNYIKIGVNFDANGNITLTSGTEGASVAAATAPPTVDNLYAIGFVVLQNVAGTIQNVTNTNIYQYVGSGGTGGSGSGNTILETLKNDFVNSPYNLMSASVISSDAATFVDGASTSSYNLVSKAISFSALGQTLVSVNMLDSTEFLADPKDIWDTRVITHWRLANIDTAATYEVSRDGGAHWQTVTMSRIGTGTECYYGEYRWQREDEDTSTQSNVTGGTDVTVTNTAGAIEAVAQKFTFSARTRGTTLRMALKKTGSPTGSYRLAIYSDNSGTPSARLFATGWSTVTSLGTSYADIDFSVNYLWFEANTQYWLVLETDATYQASAGATLQLNRSSSGTNQLYTLDGSTWSAVANATGVFAVIGGQESFAAVDSYTTAFNNSVALGTPTSSRLAQSFTIANASVIKKVVLNLAATGSGAGTLYLSVVKDSAGAPSTALADVLVTSAGMTIAGLVSGLTTFTMPTTPLAAGTYWLVLQSASDTDTSAALGISLRGNTGGSPAGQRYVSGSWTTLSTPMRFYYDITGRVLDLRMRVTSSASNKLLDAFTMLYDKEVIGASGAVQHLQKFRFLAATDNLNEFQLTAFIPNPDYLRVYHAERGNVYTFGAFSLQGSKIVFPSGFFYNAGVDETVTLLCTQFEGNAYDNSDINALLLANNFLGSTDATIDRSQAGRGIFLRRPDGTLREVTIDNNDNIAIYSV